MPAAEVKPDAILAQLRELWTGLGKQQDLPGGVLRACSMTLLVTATDNPEDISQVHSWIGELMHQHPSRAIILTPTNAGDISARVFSECWRPYHSRQQICSEGVEISFDPERSDELARFLVPLLAPDLPTVLWCRGARPFLDRSFDPLFPLARKVIFDSNAARHAPGAIEFLRRLRRDRLRVADLAWTRLTSWRQAVAHGCEGYMNQDLAVQFPNAAVVHQGSRASSAAVYLARWIERCVHGISVNLQPASNSGHEEDGGQIREVRFIGPAGQMIFRTVDGLIQVEGCHQKHFVAPALSDEKLMRDELSILDQDPVFERVLG